MPSFLLSLSRPLGMLRPARFRRHDPAVFGDIPIAPSGASFVSSSDHAPDIEPILHGMMQASVIRQPGAVFLVGLDEATALSYYPSASRLSTTEKVGKVSMSPSSAMTLLRVLFGAGRLSDFLLELIYLEHAGNEMSKPGPLAMIPPWVKGQLSPEGIYRLFCSPQRSDSTLGGALKALLHHPGFNFSILDSVSEASSTQRLSNRTERLLKEWEARGHAIAELLGEIIDTPPLPLQLLPAIRAAQEAENPSVWYVHPDDLPEIASVLDALILSHGLRQRHHWLVNADALAAASSEGLNALERLAVALWQHRDAGAEGYGPALWCNLGSEAPAVQGAKTYKHRAIQATSMVIGDETAVMNSVVNSLAIDPDAFDWKPTPGRAGMFYPKGGQFRHWKARELQAVREHVTPKG